MSPPPDTAGAREVWCVVFVSQRVGALPPYVFSELDARVAEMRARGAEVLDLGRADPDHEVPPELVRALCTAVRSPAAHHYPPFAGVAPLRAAVARWYGERYGVRLDPDGEVLILAGSKEGLFHIAMAVCDPGDVALVPDPCFPAYRMGAYFAGAEVVSLPLRPESGYLPVLSAVPEALAQRARILFLNYPNNPTGAVAPPAFFAEAVAFARRYDLLLCHDLAYGESGYDGYRAPSVLQVEGARDVAVEFLSWSKAFCIPGWRLGAVVGCRQALSALLDLETQVGSGVFPAVQLAGAAALEDVAPSGFLTALNETYRVRRDRMGQALQQLGFAVRLPRATPFLWFPCPEGRPAREYAYWLLERCGVALAPGTGFGVGGEGFLRLSLTAATEDVEEAISRLRRLGADALRRAAPAVGDVPSSRPRRGGAAGDGRRPAALPGARRPLLSPLQPEQPPDALIGSL